MPEHWNDFSKRQQRLVLVGTAVETALKAAMLIDLVRRDQREIRGRKWLWASSVVVNSAGLIPAAYFLAGRRGD